MLFRPTVLAAAASFVTVAHAQYKIEPDSVPLDTREVWCRNQIETCPLICEQTKPGTTLVNECDPEALTYGCLCGDNKKPNISEYSLTLPYFVCQEWGNQCVSGCSGDSACASSCRQDHPCGAQNPKRVKVKSTSTGSASSTVNPTASQTDDGTTIYTGSPGDASDDGDKKDGASMLRIGQSYGLAMVLGSMFVGFALL